MFYFTCGHVLDSNSDSLPKNWDKLGVKPENPLIPVPCKECSQDIINKHVIYFEYRGRLGNIDEERKVLAGREDVSIDVRRDDESWMDSLRAKVAVTAEFQDILQGLVVQFVTRWGKKPHIPDY
ncbi:hypothetical protein VTN49DRAFT_5387 [Thermomyces lanuginosus]|uniref:uncharacterized protein n=1 Tax=Thermomyces lanuginosus TaxID=5541 RepID=UPI0037448BB8